MSDVARGVALPGAGSSMEQAIMHSRGPAKAMPWQSFRTLVSDQPLCTRPSATGPACRISQDGPALCGRQLLACTVVGGTTNSLCCAVSAPTKGVAAIMAR